MFDSSALRDELEVLKDDLSRLLNTASAGTSDASRSNPEALADQIKTALSDLGETLKQEEGHLERIISDRPIVALASAFALGAAMGFMLRRN